MANLDLNTQLESGGTYTFYFSQKGASRDIGEIQTTVAADSNFQNVVAGYTGGGVLVTKVQVTFNYAGEGSSAGEAGLEMAKVLNDHFALAQFEFNGAAGGVTAPDPASDPGATALYVVGAILIGAIVLVIFSATRTAERAV